MNSDQRITPTEEQLASGRERIEKLLTERAELRTRILALFNDGAERYSAEVAEQLGVPRPGLMHYLETFERAGKLTSRFVPGDELTPPGPFGRRYFRKANAAR